MATRFIKLPPPPDEDEFDDPEPLPAPPKPKPTIQKSGFAVTRHNVFKVNKGKLNRFGQNNEGGLGLEQLKLNDGPGGEFNIYLSKVASEV